MGKLPWTSVCRGLILGRTEGKTTGGEWLWAQGEYYKLKNQ